MKFRKGDRVVVADPTYGDIPGRVAAADEKGVVVEGPHVDSRVIQYTIPADQVDSHVRPQPGHYHGRHRHGEVIADGD